MILIIFFFFLNKNNDFFAVVHVLGNQLSLAGNENFVACFSSLFFLGSV